MTTKPNPLAVMQEAEYDYLGDGFSKKADAMGDARADVAEVVDVLRECLRAMDAARDAIQPITKAQITLHRLDPLTANKLDDAATRAIAALARFGETK